MYVGHLAVVVALQALSLSLLPLAAPSAALGPAIAVGTPGTEPPGGGHWKLGTLMMTILTLFYHHRSSDSPDIGCTGYTSLDISDTEGT